MDFNTLLPLLLMALMLVMVAQRWMGKTSPETAHQLVREGARLLDVRTPGEFASGHLPDAVNIPVQELEPRLKELGDPKRPVVVYCASGMRSASAKRLLQKHGFAAVYDLGAMARW